MGGDGESLFGVFAGQLAELEGAVLVAVDEGGPVGLHAGGDGFAVEGVGVGGVVLEGEVGEALGLGDAVLEALFEGGLDVGTLAGLEAVVVGEELDVEDTEAVELGEEKGGGVGGGAEAVFGMGGHPLLEVVVRAGEVEVVHGVVAIVERGAGERGGDGEGGRQEKDEEEGVEVVSLDVSIGGPPYRREGKHCWHYFLLPHESFPLRNRLGNFQFSRNKSGERDDEKLLLVGCEMGRSGCLHPV